MRVRDGAFEYHCYLHAIEALCYAMLAIQDGFCIRDADTTPRGTASLAARFPTHLKMLNDTPLRSVI